MKIFLIEQNLREFITTWPALQELLKGVLLSGNKRMQDRIIKTQKCSVHPFGTGKYIVIVEFCNMVIVVNNSLKTVLATLYKKYVNCNNHHLICVEGGEIKFMNSMEVKLLKV